MGQELIGIDDQIIEAVGAYLPTANLTKEEAVQFTQIAKAFALNPFKREIYAIAYGNGQYRKCSIITGYEVYLKRAERTGKLDGWSVDITEDGKKATCTIYRKDWKMPLIHSVFLEEAINLKDGKPNSVWAKMPKFMLRKVAIGQAFRLAFPDELGGMPYLAEEITDRTSESVAETPTNAVYTVVEEKVIPEQDIQDTKALDAICEEVKPASLAGAEITEVVIKTGNTRGKDWSMVKHNGQVLFYNGILTTGKAYRFLVKIDGKSLQRKIDEPEDEYQPIYDDGTFDEATEADIF